MTATRMEKSDVKNKIMKLMDEFHNICLSLKISFI